MSPVLAGGFFTSEPPGKPFPSLDFFFLTFRNLKSFTFLLSIFVEISRVLCAMCVLYLKSQACIQLFLPRRGKEARKEELGLQDLLVLVNRVRQ